MKKTDIAMVVLVGGIAMGIAFFIANSIAFLKPPENGVKVRTAEKISSSVEDTSKKVFSQDAINPTVESIIGSQANK